MVIDREIADKFIEVYKSFLLFLCHEFADVAENDDLLKLLCIGRDIYLDDRELLDDFSEKYSVSPDIYAAIASLEYGQWVYLRDTTKYSLFVMEDQSASYAVLGLIDPLKLVCGSAGLYFGAGILQLGGKYVCDGLLVDPLYLGANLKWEYNEVYKELKQQGKFYKNT
jgi:hypothetical protein